MAFGGSPRCVLVFYDCRKDKSRDKRDDAFFLAQGVEMGECGTKHGVDGNVAMPH